MRSRAAAQTQARRCRCADAGGGGRARPATATAWRRAARATAAAAAVVDQREPATLPQVAAQAATRGRTTSTSSAFRSRTASCSRSIRTSPTTTHAARLAVADLHRRPVDALERAARRPKRQASARISRPRAPTAARDHARVLGARDRARGRSGGRRVARRDRRAPARTCATSSTPGSCRRTTC